MNICVQHRRDTINTQQMYQQYVDYTRSTAAVDPVLISVVPIYNRFFTKYVGSAILEGDFEDLFQDVCVKLLIFLKYNQRISHPGALYRSVNTVVRNAIVDKLGKYYLPREVNDPIALKEIRSNHGTVSQLYAKLHLKDLIYLLVEEFTTQLRFRGADAQVCYYIFDKIISKEKIDETYLKIHYNVPIGFLYNYTLVLMRRIMQDLALHKYEEFQEMV